MKDKIIKALKFFKDVCYDETLYHDVFSLKYNQRYHKYEDDYSIYFKLIKFSKKLNLPGKILLFLTTFAPYTIVTSIIMTFLQTFITCVMIIGVTAYIVIQTLIGALNYLFVNKTNNG
jgi:hypothetical protein